MELLQNVPVFVKMDIPMRNFFIQTLELFYTNLDDQGLLEHPYSRR